MNNDSLVWAEEDEINRYDKHIKTQWNLFKYRFIIIYLFYSYTIILYTTSVLIEHSHQQQDGTYTTRLTGYPESN